MVGSGVLPLSQLLSYSPRRRDASIKKCDVSSTSSTHSQRAPWFVPTLSNTTCLRKPAAIAAALRRSAALGLAPDAAAVRRRRDSDGDSMDTDATAAAPPSGGGAARGRGGRGFMARWRRAGVGAGGYRWCSSTAWRRTCATASGCRTRGARCWRGRTGWAC